MRGTSSVALLIALCWSAGVGWAREPSAPRPPAQEEIDSEHLFGFTEGTDIGTAGDREVELEGAGRFGKRLGLYNAFEGVAEGKFSLTDQFRVAPGLSLSGYRIKGVPDLEDRSLLAFQGAHVEFKYRVLDREKAPFGLTFGAVPYWARLDDKTGGTATALGFDFLASVDRELVRDALFGGANLRYTPAASRDSVTGLWSHASGLELSGALAVRARPGLFLGGEVRYAAAYDGLALDAFAGNALFVGPTFYARLSKVSWIAGGWNIQIAGHATADRASLDLVNFERHEIKVRYGHEF